MKKMFFAALMLIIGMTSIAQNHIPGTNIAFGFPEGGWKYLQTFDVDLNTKVYLYSYCKEVVIDNDGDTVLPNMKIYVRKNYAEPVFNLVMERYSFNPYQSIEEYVDGLPTSEGIGYKAYYKSMQDGKEYLFNMIYFKDKTTAVEIRIETTMDTYDRFEQKFKEILSTVNIEK